MNIETSTLGVIPVPLSGSISDFEDSKATTEKFSDNLCKINISTPAKSQGHLIQTSSNQESKIYLPTVTKRLAG